MMQRMARCQPGLRFLFVSLEQTRWEWFERARRIHRFYNLMDTDEDALDFWRNKLMLVDKNQLTQVELGSVLDDYEYRMGQPPDVVAVDYLGYYARAFKGERYERTSEAVMSLKELAKARGVVVLAPHQVSRMTKFGEEPDADAGRDSGVIEETADFMFSIWSADNAMPRTSGEEEHKTGEINLRIGKSRHGGRGSKIQFQFAPLSLTLVPRYGDAGNAALLQHARNELIYNARNETWQMAQERHSHVLPADLTSTGAEPLSTHITRSASLFGGT